MINYKTVKLIDADDFDSLVKETYGKPYCLNKQNYVKNKWVKIAPKNFGNEINDRSQPFCEWLEKDPNEISDKKERDYIWERHFYPNLDMVVNDLYEKGLIEEGEYYINLDV